MLRSPLRSPFVDLLRPSVGAAGLSIVQKAIGILRKYGTDAHVYLPGIGTVSGLTAGNYLDSAGTTPATIDNPVGLVVDPLGAVNATQATTANKAILRQSGGKYSWQFDGSNDSLSLSAPLFQMSDDHCVIAGFNASAVGVYVFSHTNTSTGVHCATVRVASDGKPSAWWRDDSTAQDVLYGPSSIVGSAAVVTAKKAAALKSLRVNGSLASSAGTSLGTTTLNEYAIGKSGAAYMQGSIYPLIGIKGTVSDAELLVLERYVGMGCGVSI